MNRISDWSDYYKITAKNPPSKLLVEAVSHVKNKNKALELGAGTNKDSKFLISEGFQNITAIDKDIDSKNNFIELLENIDLEGKFGFQICSIEDFNFEDDSYDIVSAQRAMPFIANKNTLFEVMEKIKLSLKQDGIFAGHFFGINDTWCKEGKLMTFLNREEVESIVKGVRLIKLKEYEEDSQTAKGTPHHWHIFEVIFAKENID